MHNLSDVVLGAWSALSLVPLVMLLLDQLAELTALVSDVAT